MYVWQAMAKAYLWHFFFPLKFTIKFGKAMDGLPNTSGIRKMIY
jgi:hypothetical protein